MSGTVYTWEQNSTQLYESCTKYENLYKEWEVTDFVNDFDFSLYTIASACHMIAALEGWNRIRLKITIYLPVFEY